MQGLRPLATGFPSQGCCQHEMPMKTIDIGRDFSDAPLGRFKTDGEFSGQRFREEFLAPALRESAPVHVRIDHAEGYGSSFLEEAFGGLVRIEKFPKDELRHKLVIDLDDMANYDMYRRLIWSYIDRA